MISADKQRAMLHQLGKEIDRIAQLTPEQIQHELKVMIPILGENDFKAWGGQVCVANLIKNHAYLIFDPESCVLVKKLRVAWQATKPSS
jgi:hypothetical protein